MLQNIAKMLFCLCVLNACSTMRFLISNKQKPAVGVVFKAPPLPYKKKHKKNWDALWENPQNQNRLGFFSNCSADIAFSSPIQLEKELLSDLKQLQVVSKKNQSLRGYPARHLLLKGQGPNKNSINIEFFVFKKQKCFYVINLLVVTLKDKTKAQKIFNQFIQGFKAP